MLESDGVELLLGDRSGDHRRSRSGASEADRKLERVERAVGPGYARMARHVGLGRVELDQGQAIIECRIRLSGILNDLDRSVPYTGDGARIADSDEGRKAVLLPAVPAFGDDLGPNPCGIAQRNG